MSSMLTSQDWQSGDASSPSTSLPPWGEELAAVTSGSGPGSRMGVLVGFGLGGWVPPGLCVCVGVCVSGGFLHLCFTECDGLWGVVIMCVCLWAEMGLLECVSAGTMYLGTCV